jgi:xanthine dehydrogenase YagS FAD-binding subunit
LKTFTHINATSLADVEDRLDDYGSEAMLIAGGTDLIPFLEARCLPREQLPKYIINLKTIPDLDYITEDSGGLKLGAMATLHNIAFSSVVLGKWEALAKATRLVAKWQVRTMATIGGNICCKKRCWYYRAVWNKFDCVLKGGTGCPAVAGNHRYESVFGATNGCYSVNPNDTPPVLVALNATIVTNKNSYPAEDFFDGFKVTKMGAGEFVTEIQVPAPAAGSKQCFEKGMERRLVDFASANVACLITPATGTITDARIAMGAMGTTPILSNGGLVGKTLSESTVGDAAEKAVDGANPISSLNAYKVAMVKGLIKRALLS